MTEAAAYDPPHFAAEAVVAGGSVAAAAAIAMLIRLYFIGSNRLSVCSKNVVLLVTSVLREAIMIQTSVSL